MTRWQWAIFAGLDRSCTALDDVSSAIGRRLRWPQLGGVGCRLGLSGLAHTLHERWMVAG